MKKLLAVALLAVAVGLVLLKTRPWDAGEPVTAGNGATAADNSVPSIPDSVPTERLRKDAPRPAPKVERIESAEPPTLDFRLQAKIDDQSKKDSILIADLTKRLGLDDAQKAHLEGLLADRREKLAGLLTKGGDAAAMGTAEGVKAFGSLLGEDFLAKNLAGVLSPAQLASYEESRKELLGRQVEGRAYQELAKVTPVLSLTEDQKDKVFEALHKASEEKLREEADIRSVIAFMTGDVPGVGPMTEAMMPMMSNLLRYGDIEETFGNPQKLAEIKEAEQKRIDAEVAVLAPHLTPEQATRYRENLESSSMVNKLLLMKKGSDPAPTKPH